MQRHGCYLIIAFVLLGQLCLTTSFGDNKTRIGSNQSTVATKVAISVQRPTPKPRDPGQVTPAQRSAIKNPRVIAPGAVVPMPQPVPAAKLTADRSRIQVGEEVKFSRNSCQSNGAVASSWANSRR